jgi:hypothetical protein
MNNGIGEGKKFYENNETSKKLLGYLKSISSSLSEEFRNERNIAEKKFDDALK